MLLLEDSAALLGLTFALVGVSLAELTGDAIWDGIGTLGIGALLVVVAFLLAREMKSLLIGESATPEDTVKVEEALRGTDGITSVIHCMTQHIGPDELLVAVKAEFDPALTIPDLAAAVDAAEARIREAVPIAGRIYIEPDLRRGG